MKLARRQLLNLGAGAAAAPLMSRLASAQPSAIETEALANFQKTIDSQNDRLRALLAADANEYRALANLKTLDLPGSGELLDRSWQLYAGALRAKFTGGLNGRIYS